MKKSVKNENLDIFWSVHARMHLVCIFFNWSRLFSVKTDCISGKEISKKNGVFEFSSTINGCTTLFVSRQNTKSVAQPLIVELNSKHHFFRFFFTTDTVCFNREKSGSVEKNAHKIFFIFNRFSFLTDIVCVGIGLMRSVGKFKFDPNCICVFVYFFLILFWSFPGLYT